MLAFGGRPDQGLRRLRPPPEPRDHADLVETDQCRGTVAMTFVITYELLSFSKIRGPAKTFGDS
jgi:hypothetical protein